MYPANVDQGDIKNWTINKDLLNPRVPYIRPCISLFQRKLGAPQRKLVFTITPWKCMSCKQNVLMSSLFPREVQKASV